MKETVILVDENDLEVGTMDKLEAHQRGLLHRAFSIFIFNDNREMLLQQRALDKYHSSGLWTNTCCSHPRQGEKTIDAATRRLMEEMGISSHLTECFQFTYKADVGGGLTEHEFDHVFTGYYDGIPEINPEEVASWKYTSVEFLKIELKLNPHSFTAWFKLAFEQILARGVPEGK